MYKEEEPVISPPDNSSYSHSRHNPTKDSHHLSYESTPVYDKNDGLPVSRRCICYGIALMCVLLPIILLVALIVSSSGSGSGEESKC